MFYKYVFNIILIYECTWVMYVCFEADSGIITACSFGLFVKSINILMAYILVFFRLVRYNIWYNGCFKLDSTTFLNMGLQKIERAHVLAILCNNR